MWWGVACRCYDRNVNEPSKPNCEKPVRLCEAGKALGGRACESNGAECGRAPGELGAASRDGRGGVGEERELRRQSRARLLKAILCSPLARGLPCVGSLGRQTYF